MLNSLVGSVVGEKYRIDSVLGVGGLGEVYEATNLSFGRKVAFKVLKPEFSERAEIKSRFAREARAAHLVRHPNVVDVLDAGTTESGLPYLVLELLRGEDFETYLKRKSVMDLPSLFPRIIPVIDAVAHAHTMGVVHRDLKPANIFLCDAGGGRVVSKVLDFGISKLTAGGDIAQTQVTNGTLGTPHYMAPEQIRAEAVDGRTDIWALGVILYELMTGEPPFVSMAVSALLVEICADDITPLEDRRPTIPASFAALVNRCLRREPDERFQSATELRDALIACADELGLDPFEEPITSEHFIAPHITPRPTPTSPARRTPSASKPRITPSTLPGTPAAIEASATLQQVAGPRRTRAPLYLAAAAVLLGGIGLFAWSRTAEVPTPDEPPAVLVAPPQTTVTLDIAETPTGATALIRGRSYPVPIRTEIERSTTSETILVEAEGYAPRTLTLTLDRSVRVEVPLVLIGSTHVDAPTVAEPSVTSMWQRPVSRNVAPQPVHVPSEPTLVPPPPPVEVPTVVAVVPQVAVPATTPVRPEPTPEAPAVPTSRTSASVRASITAHRGEITHCVNQARALDPLVGGRVTIQLTVNEDGSVQRAVASGGQASPRLIQCFQQSAVSWRFSPVAGGTSTINYPVDLE